MRRYTVRDFDRQFPDDAACLAYLFKAYNALLWEVERS